MTEVTCVCGASTLNECKAVEDDAPLRDLPTPELMEMADGGCAGAQKLATERLS